MVIVAVPVSPAVGVMVTVRFAPLPPSTMVLAGTSVTFEDAANSVRLSGSVSASPMVKGTGPSTVSMYTF